MFSMTRSQEFIQKYKKDMVSGSMFYNPDTSLMTLEDFEKAKCKILVIFGTPNINKSVSSTAAALNDFVISHCPDCFIDFAYIPEGQDIKLYDNNRMPWAIGNITHLDPSHYDYVGFSISVLSEIVGVPVILKTFDRCDTPIPLFWSDRKDLPIGSCPIIQAGGITAAYGEVMYGTVNTATGTKTSFIDFAYLGSCEKQDIVWRRFIEARDTGKVTRYQKDHYVLGSDNVDYEDFEDIVSVTTTQEYIDSLFDLQNIYQPQAYKVVYNKYNRIIENTKINPRAQDYVMPYYPHELSNDLGISRAIINGNGWNTGVTQTQISEGCSAGGMCSFSVTKGTRLWTNRGLLKIEDATNSRTVTALDEEPFLRVDKQPSSAKVKVYTKDGHLLECDTNHKFMVVVNDRLVEKTTNELTEGDVILRRLGNYVSVCGYLYYGDKLLREEFAELLGLLNGGGCFDTLGGTDQSYRVAEEIFRSPKPVIRAYLSGVFKVNGFYDKLLGISSYSEGFIRDISLLLSYIGIDSFIVSYSSEDGTVWSIRIDPFYSDKFMEELDINRYQWIPYSSLQFKRNIVLSDSIISLVWSVCDEQELLSKGLVSFISTTDHLISDDEIRRLKSTDVYDLLPDSSVTKLIASGSFVSDTIDKVIFTDEVVEMYDVVNTTTHLCVYGTFLTHQCAEGNYTSGWVEKPRDVVMKEVLEAKKYSAGYKFKAFSFNLNYYTDYKGLIYDLTFLYPKLSFINMRMEELGRDTDAMKMMKEAGANKIACPMEGMSPRVMNNLLNKCLSDESLNNFMNQVIHMKLVEIKVGGIFTAYEEDEDFKWIVDYVNKYKEKAINEKGNINIRMKMTPLVHYPLTALEYIERKSSEHSYFGEHWLTDEWYYKFREAGINFKVNGFRFSTFVEQSILDLGRSLTQLVYDEFVVTESPIYSLRTVVTPSFLEKLKLMVNPFEGRTDLSPEEEAEKQKYIEGQFGDRPIDSYISPGHRIHLELLGSYIERARSLIECKENGNIFDNPENIRCLKTYDGAKTKCYKYVAKKRPLVIYNDVKLVDGKLLGKGRLLLGCERCKSDAERKSRLARKHIQTKTSSDIANSPGMRKAERIRFVIYRNEDYDVLNPNNTAHTFLTKFLQKSDRLLNSFHSIDCHSMQWQSRPETTYIVAGYQVIDTFWSDYVIDEVQSLIDDVNKDLKSVKVVSAKKELLQDHITIEDFNVIYLESSLPFELFESAKFNYNGSMRLYAQRGIERIEDKALLPPIFAVADKVYGVCLVPVKYNPVEYLFGFLSSSRSVPLKKIVNSTKLVNILTVTESKAPCRRCNKSAFMSLVSGKVLPFCPECLMKSILSMKVKSMSK